MADKDQKTHAPTEKKLADARAKGDVANAQEMRHAIMFTGAIIVAASLGGGAIMRIAPLLTRLWSRADDYPLEPAGSGNFATGVMLAVGSALLPVMALLLVLALLTAFSQGRPSFAWSRLGLKWSKLSPVAGLGRIFGMKAAVEFAKTLAKLGAVITIAAVVVWPKAIGMTQLIGSEPGDIGHASAAIVVQMMKAIVLLVVTIAAFDFLWQRHSYLKKMMMSLQEIKDEHKQSEGDPAIKARIRAIGMARARKRMMAAVPGASVIITNPTHYAIALRYDHGAMAAPVVVAKGVDLVALRIREVAKGAGVPIVESPVLARAIYASVAIDRPIPVEHYAAVAEIIGYVMRLAKRR
jgi:flagellar biosynthetic protein FlhB